jgi:hypothetical protein
MRRGWGRMMMDAEDLSCTMTIRESEAVDRSIMDVDAVHAVKNACVQNSKLEGGL